MAKKLTKSQQKRMIHDIKKKAGKLFLAFGGPGIRGDIAILSVKEFAAIDKICKAALKRVG